MEYIQIKACVQLNHYGVDLKASCNHESNGDCIDVRIVVGMIVFASGISNGQASTHGSSKSPAQKLSLMSFASGRSIGLAST